ncbi:dTDP-4-dehydrorhamnose 3,5-epimerase [Pandoraea fibrosis]|uniref:dTDP-4-dehydrorhamnose 3,5-epimerase n=1 Tax=Pandoraea fibrosis TaxID=1891094 RepID=A0A5E4XR60_9BURK|nr:dTDP-4-dehydrorhamnose 3,5-epimerase [Pandoraea fibrosis]QHE93640.1 dTDP-4-dehydrorhamnose 3,5-epimerase [Pandoraea fibrosis]QHF12798.1 dTDP-4-dehydrorhamnose 3,5-epimerase [Pandoraea fibrosis]VVE38961.1 dTDP-4-dehydrorhamnose 3,5-epimerase [Pandoraea fibrosis]
MQVIPTAIPAVRVIEPKVFGDSRGHFFESFNQRNFDDALGETLTFVQDNQSRSARGVLRGLHYQVKQPQGKLVRVLQGEIYDVAVDIREGSPTFGKWVAEVLSAENKKQLWIPAGFAHGFVVTSETAEVLYKTTDYWAPQFERCIRWDDPTLAIPWPLDGITPIVSDKDRQGMLFSDYQHED